MAGLRSIRAVVVSVAAAGLLIGMPTQVTPMASAALAWKVPVAMYHIVTPNAPDTSISGLFVRSSEFDAQMRAAAAKGVRTITAHDLNASVRGGIPIPRKVMVLTFDDGRVESIRYAWPIMQKYGSSLMFNGTAWVARDMNLDGVADKGYIGSFFVIVGRGGGNYLTYDQEAALATAGNEISNHTNSHVDVAAYHGSALFSQVVTAGRRLESEMAKRGVLHTISAGGVVSPGLTAVVSEPVDVTTFVYPYGDTATEAVNLLRANGYGMAFTTVPGIASSGQNMLLLPRVRVNRGESSSTFLKSMGL